MEDRNFENVWLEIQRLPEAGFDDVDPSGVVGLMKKMKPRVEAAGLDLRTLTFDEAERLFPELRRRRNIPIPARILRLLDEPARPVPPSARIFGDGVA